MQAEHFEPNAWVRLQDIFVCWNVHCVRLGNGRVINSCRVVAERHDRLHVAPWSIIVCSSWRVMSTARKRSLTTTTTTDKPSWEVNKKSGMLVFLSLGHEVSYMQHWWSSIMTHYARWNDQLSSAMIDLFRACLTPHVFPVWLLSGWYRGVWPQFKCDWISKTSF